MRRALAVLAVLALPACASAPTADNAPPQYANPADATAPSQRELQSYDSLHFTVRGWSYDNIVTIGALAEDLYKKIMFDTNLLSFKPRQNYGITIYADQAEYHNRTGYPAWSGGATLTVPLGEVLPSEKDARPRTAIVTYESAALPSVLAHEISHLIFNEFMGFATTAESDRLLWLNEGFATYEEFQTYDQSERDQFLDAIRPLLQAHAYSMDELTRFRPASEPVQTVGSYFFNGQARVCTNIDLWYWQASSLTSFLIRRQGEYQFYLLLNALKRRQDLLGALSEAYPGKWSTLDDLENEWKQSI